MTKDIGDDRRINRIKDFFSELEVYNAEKISILLNFSKWYGIKMSPFSSSKPI
ncbi:MAG: hypothetical protein L0H53_14525 [Candidatus Nitrosocosmicus sp.]|nr:hypothetical protein [Candidatus Nitrosocosmicus sp.]MDN5866402.1 hypothetical protein [Candidatus Nitrosocosmicus sp.]